MGQRQTGSLSWELQEGQSLLSSLAFLFVFVQEKAKETNMSLMDPQLGAPGLQASAFQAGGFSSLGSQELNANSRRLGPAKVSCNYQPRTM